MNETFEVGQDLIDAAKGIRPKEEGETWTPPPPPKRTKTKAKAEPKPAPKAPVVMEMVGADVPAAREEVKTDLVGQSGEDPGLPGKLDTARQALASATTDFERVRVRDHAAAVQAAAAILERREIQVEASILVSEEEREIAKANPPKPAGRPKTGEIRDSESQIS